MGLFWELWQQSKIGEAKGQAQNVDERVAELEDRVYHLESELERLYRQLDEYFDQLEAVMSGSSAEQG